MPVDEAAVPRQLEELRRQIRELGPSVAKSFKSTVENLRIAVDAATEAAASTIVAEAGGTSTSEQGVSTTSNPAASVSFTVPEGYTRALVMGTGVAMAYNNSGTGDYLYVMVVINGNQGGEVYNYAPSGFATSASIPNYVSLTDLAAGEAITVTADVRTSYGTWTPSAANMTTIYAQVQFLR